MEIGTALLIKIPKWFLAVVIYWSIDMGKGNSSDSITNEEPSNDEWRSNIIGLG